MLLRTTVLAALGSAALLCSGQVLAESPSAACGTHTAALADALGHGDFAKAGADFTPELAGKLDAKALGHVWATLQTQSGAYRDHEAPLVRANVMSTDLVFAKGTQVMLTRCDSQDRIETVRIMPKAMAGLLSHAVKPHPEEPHALAGGGRVLRLDVPSPAGPLFGALTLPAGEGPFPAVVLVSGSGDNDRDELIGPNRPFRDIAEGLARLGIASLRYDKRNFDYNQTWGDKTGRVIDSEVTDDAVTAARLLAKQPHVDAHRVFVVGHSLGAMMAPRIGRRDPQLAGLVLMAGPARHILDALEQQAREQSIRAGLSAEDVRKSVQAVTDEKALLAKVGPGQDAPAGNFSNAPQTYWLSWQRVDPLADARALSMPMLFLQGASDFQVSPTLDFGRWKEALGQRDNTAFHLYPGLSHLFMPAGKTGTIADYTAPATVDPKVITDLATWIKAQPALEKTASAAP
ncbi:alpha/beta hydrolase family protein [Frateuria sp. GZRR35]|uniref:alpha/beta hydrolase family protein n=1 Tax=Frateuria sp. GZRR35 TaxID=3351536 RepID=UPI003EDBB756